MEKLQKKGSIMPKKTDRKKELDKQRNEWRKKHRTLRGRIILYPNKPPEHINARGSKTYNWFWKEVLLAIKTQDIPAIISTIKNQISSERDSHKIRTYRTMIGMAEDAYQLKRLDDIMDYDPDLKIGKNPVYNTEQGVIYKEGKIYTTDYSEDESKIIVRDMEGIIVDEQYSKSVGQETSREDISNNAYRNWNYVLEN